MHVNPCLTGVHVVTSLFQMYYLLRALPFALYCTWPAHAHYHYYYRSTYHFCRNTQVLSSAAQHAARERPQDYPVTRTYCMPWRTVRLGRQWIDRRLLRTQTQAAERHGKVTCRQAGRALSRRRRRRIDRPGRPKLARARATPGTCCRQASPTRPGTSVRTSRLPVVLYIARVNTGRPADRPGGDPRSRPPYVLGSDHISGQRWMRSQEMIERECDLLGAPVRTGRAGGAHRAGAIDAADRPAGKDVPGVPTYATVPGRSPADQSGRQACKHGSRPAPSASPPNRRELHRTIAGLRHASGHDAPPSSWGPAG